MQRPKRAGAAGGNGIRVCAVLMIQHVTDHLNGKRALRRWDRSVCNFLGAKDKRGRPYHVSCELLYNQGAAKVITGSATDTLILNIPRRITRVQTR